MRIGRHAGLIPAVVQIREYLLDTIAVRSNRRLDATERSNTGRHHLTATFGDPGAARELIAASAGYSEARYPAGWDPPAGGVRAQVSRTGRRVRISAPGRNAAQNTRLVRGLLPLALARQGRVSLHAAALSCEGRLLALVGSSGVGKSTLATRLTGHGYDLVTDDLLFATIVGGEVRFETGTGPSLPGCSASLCFLERRPDATSRPSVERLPAAAALRLLLRHGFGELGHPGEPTIWARQFELYTALVEQAELVRLCIPDSIERIEESANVLEAIFLEN